MFRVKLTCSLFLLAHTAYPLLTSIITLLKNVIHRGLLLFLLLALRRVIMRMSGIAEIAKLDKARRQYSKMFFAEVHRQIADALHRDLHHAKLIRLIIAEGAGNTCVLAHAVLLLACHRLSSACPSRSWWISNSSCQLSSRSSMSEEARYATRNPCSHFS